MVATPPGCACALDAEAIFAEATTRVDTVSLAEQLTLSGEGVEIVFTALEPASSPGS